MQLKQKTYTFDQNFLKNNIAGAVQLSPSFFLMANMICLEDPTLEMQT